ncbi:hypothetical protein KCO_10635 [Pectobacterium brasiliense ICMP 19477]|nr:hypothetical protein KCO_10635 [Pectobacterium brasiliense ICMP 19477]
MVVDWTELVLPALLATGAPCGAPAQPTIEM